MAKKKSRKSRVSKGIVGSPAKARTSTGIQRLINQLNAYKAGKRTRVVIPVGFPGERNSAKYKTVDGSAVWGDKFDKNKAK